MTPAPILFVCTGNVCRSPLARLLMEAGLRALGATTPVTSAGTGAVVGAPMSDDEQLIARRLGLDPTGHVGRAVDPDEVRTAALVLTMTRAQRRALVVVSPEAVRRIFTLREFERLLSGVGAGEGRADPPEDLDSALPVIVDTAARRRGLAPADVPDADDVDDPMGRPQVIHEQVAAEIDAAIRSVIGSFARLTGRPAA